MLTCWTQVRLFAAQELATFYSQFDESVTYGHSSVKPDLFPKLPCQRLILSYGVTDFRHRLRNDDVMDFLFDFKAGN